MADCIADSISVTLLASRRVGGGYVLFRILEVALSPPSLLCFSLVIPTCLPRCETVLSSISPPVACCTQSFVRYFCVCCGLVVVHWA